MKRPRLIRIAASAILLPAPSVVGTPGPPAAAAFPAANTSESYSRNGTQNNVDRPFLGAAGRPRIRSHPPLNGYEDGLSVPRSDLPNPGRILAELYRAVPPRPVKDVSQLELYFGQWVAHDITRSIDSTAETMNIPCAAGRGAAARAAFEALPRGGKFCPAGGALAAPACPAGEAAGGEAAAPPHMPFFRTTRGRSDAVWAQRDAADPVFPDADVPINYASAFLDLDHMYGPVIGSDVSQSQLRSYSGGRMALDDNTDLPPQDGDGNFLVADPQTLSSPALFSIEVLFRRYHNLRADELRKRDPAASDEDLYHAARMETISVYQNIFEEAYVPTLLGEALDPYDAAEGYDPGTDPSVDVFFATCAFRYGHSGISGQLRLLDSSFRPLPRDPVLLRDAFGNVGRIVSQLGNAGVAPILRGLAAEPSRAIDASFVDDMSVFTEAMAVRNVQRGRDNGLPSYNDAREWFNLPRAASMDDLAGDDEVAASALRGLYGEDGVDDVDAYVGSLLELPNASTMGLGPLMTASLKDQFGRLRDGDRLWYKARYRPEDYHKLPSLSEIIKTVFGEEEMKFFPKDSFAVVDSSAAGQEHQSVDGASLIVLSDVYTVSWANRKNRTGLWLEMSMNVNEKIEGGFIGIGWGADAMHGSEMWFCTRVAHPSGEMPSNCAPVPLDSTDRPTAPTDQSPFFSCCVTIGSAHSAPQCANEEYKRYYPLEVVNSCVSEQSSFVTVRAPVCKSDGDERCFRRPEAEIEFIAAYNPSNVVRPHGFSRRTSGRVNLMSGSGAAVASDSAQAGLFALHGAAMMVCWFVLVPSAIYIVRYMKGKTWRLTAHIALVGIAGSLMLSLALAALVSVEGTSFGTVDGGSSTSPHKVVGLTIVALVGFQVVTGELRRTRELSKVVKQKWLEQAVFRSHRFGGFALIALSWWNCYTGFVQIGPYEGDDVDLTMFSSHTTSLGYDLEFFGFFRQYIFFPYIAVVCLIFLVTEFLQRRSRGTEHVLRAERVRKGTESIWGDRPFDGGLQTMQVETFLELTRNGSAFCIADGYVIDVGSFAETHPGGTRVLRFAIGSDITPYLLGDSDVDGARHLHSPLALRTLRTLVKAKLEIPADDTRASFVSTVSSSGKARRRLSRHGMKKLLFREATLLSNEYVTAEKNAAAKPVVRICLAMKREKDTDLLLGTPLPSTTFFFRARGDWDDTVERAYTPVKCYLRDTSADDVVLNDHSSLPEWLPHVGRRKNKQEEETVVYEFFINLLSQGKMSSALTRKKSGSHIMVQGPLVREQVLRKLDHRKSRGVMLIAQGTGLSPMLQVIDYLLDGASDRKLKLSGSPRTERPRIFLAWICQSSKHSFEDAAQLRERAERARGHFTYFIIDHDESPVGLVHAGKSCLSRGRFFSALGKTLDGATLRSTSRPNVNNLSVIAEGSFGDEPRKQKTDDTGKSTLRTSELRSVHGTDGGGASLAPHISVDCSMASREGSNAYSCARASVQAPVHLREGNQFSATAIAGASKGRLNDEHVVSAAALSAPGTVSSTSSAVALSSGTPVFPDTSNTKLLCTDSDSGSRESSLRLASDCSEDKSIDFCPVMYWRLEEQKERADFLERYHMKGRLDLDLMGRLLSLATNTGISDHTHSGSDSKESTSDDEDDELPYMNLNNTVCVCGRPAFEDECVAVLEELGMDPDEVLVFKGGDTPLNQIPLVQEKKASRFQSVIGWAKSARVIQSLATESAKC